MIKDIKYLIIPDVHGRDFWIHPVEEVMNSRNSQIVFLGDYTDPYPVEWKNQYASPREADVESKKVTLERFKQILDIKKSSPERVALLLGNHDCGYAIGDDICNCRSDWEHRREIVNLFEENKHCFLLAKQIDIAGRRIIFSHAGILKGWARSCWGDDVDKPGFNVVARLNNAWLVDDYHILNNLGDYDSYRGWGGCQYGSPIWSDIRSWADVTPEETFGFNIVGHTQLKNPMALHQIAGLDCHRAFYLDSEGSIRDYYTDVEVKKYEI